MKQLRIIVKVNQDSYHKYHSKNLLSFVKFLDKDYPTWRYFNVYDGNTERQIANYTKNNRPTTKIP
jgi:hypothetical protein